MTWLGRRSAPYATTAPTPLPEHAYGDNWVADNGLRLLDDAPAGRPWFLQVNFPGPHDPMDVTQRMSEAWQGVDFPPAHAGPEFDTATHTAIRRNYAAMVENIDRHLGRYLAAVAARGELEKTLVVYSSDHGEMLGDHELWGKSTYYQPSVGVPLVIAGPGVTAGQTFDGPVSLHDLAATFLEVAEMPVPDEMDSRSLCPLLDGSSLTHREAAASPREAEASHGEAEASPREAVLSGLITPRRTWHLAYDGRHKLVRVDGRPPILFDLDEDPWEDTDIALDRPAVVARLRAWLDAALAGS